MHRVLTLRGPPDGCATPCSAASPTRFATRALAAQMGFTPAVTLH